MEDMRNSAPSLLQTVEFGSPAALRRERSQLRRLETLTDVVYGIAIWRVFMLFPRPDQPQWSWHSWREFLSAEGMTVVLIAIGVTVLIIYWLQSNTLFSLVERADSKFAVRAIVQLFFVLLFLFSIRVGTELPASAWTRGFESFAALLLGLSSSWMWTYAARNRRLLHADVTDDEARAVSRRIKAEPATALFTMPFVFTPIFWELAWFTYPAAKRFFRRAASRIAAGKA
jgi:uncharacterized membrane protein